MGSNSDKREVASIAEINYVLPRRIEDLRCFTGRKPLIILRFLDASLSYMLSHAVRVYHKHKKHNMENYLVFLVFRL
jgi:hypothetical protein